MHHWIGVEEAGRRLTRVVFAYLFVALRNKQMTDLVHVLILLDGNLGGARGCVCVGGGGREAGVKRKEKGGLG